MEWEMDRGKQGGRSGEMVEMTVNDPSGAHEILHLFAERLDTLNGKVIAQLAAAPAKWQPHRTFPLIEEEIKKKYPQVRFISFSEFPQGLQISEEDVATLVKEKGADACIIGNAA
jgi:hypothetical protein